MNGIVVLRAVDSLPVAQTRKVAHEKICLERLGTVVILPGALLKGQPVLRTVVPVVADNAHAVAETQAQLAYKCRFAASRTAGNAYHKCFVIHRYTSFVFCLGFAALSCALVVGDALRLRRA